MKKTVLYRPIEIPRDPEVMKVLDQLKAEGMAMSRFALRALREKMIRDGLLPAESKK
jgi:hypothetical protein